MTSRGQCPRVCVLVNVFTPPPPPFRKSSIRAWYDITLPQQVMGSVYCAPCLIVPHLPLNHNNMKQLYISHHPCLMHQRISSGLLVVFEGSGNL